MQRFQIYLGGSLSQVNQLLQDVIKGGLAFFVDSWMGNMPWCGDCMWVQQLFSDFLISESFSVTPSFSSSPTISSVSSSALHSPFTL